MLKNEFTSDVNYIWAIGGLVNVKGPGFDLRHSDVKQEKKLQPSGISSISTAKGTHSASDCESLRWCLVYHTARRYI